MDLERALSRNVKIRAIGFDDAPFDKNSDEPVHVAGIVCALSQFEGMLWTQIVRDGMNATTALISALSDSKFLPQIHVVLTDGIALGGFNVIDLPTLSEALQRPCIAVMRKRPDLSAVENALRNLPRAEDRWALVQAAGTIFEFSGGFFQVAGTTADVARAALESTLAQGHVPEPLRIAHLIGSAVKRGESSNRA